MKLNKCVTNGRDIMSHLIASSKPIIIKMCPGSASGHGMRAQTLPFFYMI